MVSQTSFKRQSAAEIDALLPNLLILLFPWSPCSRAVLGFVPAVVVWAKTLLEPIFRGGTEMSERISLWLRSLMIITLCRNLSNHP